MGAAILESVWVEHEWSAWDQVGASRLGPGCGAPITCASRLRPRDHIAIISRSYRRSHSRSYRPNSRITCTGWLGPPDRLDVRVARPNCRRSPRADPADRVPSLKPPAPWASLASHSQRSLQAAEGQLPTADCRGPVRRPDGSCPLSGNCQRNDSRQAASAVLTVNTM